MQPLQLPVPGSSPCNAQCTIYSNIHLMHLGIVVFQFISVIKRCFADVTLVRSVPASIAAVRHHVCLQLATMCKTAPTHLARVHRTIIACAIVGERTGADDAIRGVEQVAWSANNGAATARTVDVIHASPVVRTRNQRQTAVETWRTSIGMRPRRLHSRFGSVGHKWHHCDVACQSAVLAPLVIAKVFNARECQTAGIAGKRSRSTVNSRFRFATRLTCS